MVWRYGTERPCNLVGRYVSIVADISERATFKIQLCHFAVLGQREPIPDEVEEPNNVPPSFAENLRASFVIFGESLSWVLPEIITGSAAFEKVVVVPKFILASNIFYDAETNSITFKDSETNLRIKNGMTNIKISLVDVNGLTNEYYQILFIKKPE